jgi:hypothetical protein
MRKKIIFVLVFLFIMSLGYSERGSIIFFGGNQWVSDKNIQDIYGINFLRYGGELNINGYKSLGFFLKFSHQSQYGKTSYTKEETFIEMNPIIYGIKFGNQFFVKVGMMNMRFQEKNPAPMEDFKDSTSGYYMGGGGRLKVIGPIHLQFEIAYTKGDYTIKFDDGTSSTIKLGGISTDVGFAITF